MPDDARGVRTKCGTPPDLYLFGVVFTYPEPKIYFDEVSLSRLLVGEHGFGDGGLLLCTLRLTEALIVLRRACTRAEKRCPGDFSPWLLP